jgi:hypothetical protein
MCRVTVNCHCHRGGGSGWIGVAALVALAFIAAPVIVAAVKAAVDLLTAVAVIEERSLRRHNERMAQIHPHLRAHLHKEPRRTRATAAIPASRPQPITPVLIYPTPRSELAAGRSREVV